MIYLFPSQKPTPPWGTKKMYQTVFQLHSSSAERTCRATSLKAKVGPWKSSITYKSFTYGDTTRPIKNRFPPAGGDVYLSTVNRILKPTVVTWINVYIDLLRIPRTGWSVDFSEGRQILQSQKTTKDWTIERQWEWSKNNEKNGPASTVAVAVAVVVVVVAVVVVVGCWLLAVGCWLLAVGCWLLAVGCWLLAVGCWLLVVGCWLLVVGCLLFVVCCLLFVVCCLLFVVCCLFFVFLFFLFFVFCCWLLVVGCWLLVVVVVVVVVAVVVATEKL